MRVRFGLDFTRRIERTLDEPLVLMTQRRRLDAYLVEQAAAQAPSSATASR